VTIQWLLQRSTEAFHLILELATPVLIATIAIGVGIAIIQAATQIQEQTISFVPKILVTFYVLIVKGPYMLSKFESFWRKILDDLLWLGRSYY